MGGYARRTRYYSATAICPYDGKECLDIKPVIYAMDLLHWGRFDGFCLVSWDADFTRLSTRIREQRMEAFGFSSIDAPAALQLNK
ncbi:NYN domain-containing protein [Pararhizobium sp. LjRoot238]